MYRLLRKFRARVRTWELAVFFVVFIAAVVTARGVSVWYRAGGSELGFVASVNTIGDDTNGYGLLFESQLRDHETDSPQTKTSSDLAADISENDETLGTIAKTLISINKSTQNLQVQQDARIAQLNDGSDDGVGWGRDIDTAYPGADTADGSFSYGITSNEFDGLSSVTGSDGDVSKGTSTDKDEFETTDEKPSDKAINTEEYEGPLYTVKVVVDDNRHVFETPGMTVAELFTKNGISVGKNDRLSGAYLDGTINSDLYIKVRRLESKNVVRDVTIEAKVVYRENSKMDKGETNIVREGANGLKRVEYEILYENGVEVGQNIIKEEILKDPVSKVVEQGSIGSRMDHNGNAFSYERVIDVKCTAYNSEYESTGKRPGDKAYGITASGAKAKKGIVAVDPSVIPLGTRLYIDILDESVDDYGYAVAGDTGGKIKGKKVDLYFEKSYNELMQFGVHKAKVYILE